jgi:beta-glucosidase
LLAFLDIIPAGNYTVTPPKSGYSFTPDSANVTITSQLKVGYRWYQSQGITPLFPFGFGLSYTTFAVEQLTVTTPTVLAGDPVTLQVGVTNTGEREGAEVLQAYVAYPAELGEPPKQLRAFQKVTLQPGESQSVQLTLNPRALPVWDTDADDWVVNHGTYRVLVGTSSADTPLEATVTVQ